MSSWLVPEFERVHPKDGVIDLLEYNPAIPRPEEKFNVPRGTIVIDCMNDRIIEQKHDSYK